MALFGTFSVILALLFYIRALITPKKGQLWPAATFEREKIFAKFKKRLRDNFKQFNMFKKYIFGQLSHYYKSFGGGDPLNIAILHYPL